MLIVSSIESCTCITFFMSYMCIPRRNDHCMLHLYIYSSLSILLCMVCLHCLLTLCPWMSCIILQMACEGSIINASLFIVVYHDDVT